MEGNTKAYLRDCVGGGRVYEHGTGVSSFKLLPLQCNTVAEWMGKTVNTMCERDINAAGKVAEVA